MSIYRNPDILSFRQETEQKYPTHVFLRTETMPEIYEVTKLALEYRVTKALSVWHHSVLRKAVKVNHEQFRDGLTYINKQNLHYALRVSLVFNMISSLWKLRIGLKIKNNK